MHWGGHALALRLTAGLTPPSPNPIWRFPRPIAPPWRAHRDQHALRFHVAELAYEVADEAKEVAPGVTASRLDLLDRRYRAGARSAVARDEGSTLATAYVCSGRAHVVPPTSCRPNHTSRPSVVPPSPRGPCLSLSRTHAIQAAWALARRRALHRSVEQLLTHLLKTLTHPAVASRKGALKALQAVIERDQTLLTAVRPRPPPPGGDDGNRVRVHPRHGP